jgi:hypothetical protein
MAAPLWAWGAADPGVSATVQATPESVTLSRTDSSGEQLATFAAYRVALRNDTTTALRAYFHATASNVGGSDAVVFTAALPSGLACTGLGTASVRCDLGSMAPGAAQALLLVVRAPTNGSQIRLDYETGGDEGKVGSNGCCSLVGNVSTALTDPLTDPSYRRQVTSFVLPEGGTFYTGDGAVSAERDGWTTRVVVPPFDADTTASIAEEALDASCSPYALAGGCYRTALSIPGTFTGLLKIQFRWDKSLYRLAKPEQARLYYRKLPTDTPFALALCSSSGPAPGVPCLASPPRKLGSQDTANKELWGDLQFDVLALDNGVYEN